MKTFSYKGYDASGQAQRGLIEATDIKSAREQLMRRGIFTEDVVSSETTTGVVASAGRGRRGFTTPARSVFYHELGVLIESGIPLVSALTLLLQSSELESARPVLSTVRDRVREGASLASALGEVPEIKPYETAILEAGERSGALAETLSRLSRFVEEQHLLRERVVTALIYPAIVASFALVMAVVMLGFVVPSAARLLTEEARVTLPLLTRIMMRLGSVLLWALPVLLAAGIGFFIGLRRKARRENLFAERLDRLFFRLPLVGRGYLLLVNLRFSRTMAILLQGGVPIVQAVALAGRATGSDWISGASQRESDAVRHGSTLADAIGRIPPLALMLPGWIQAGEASGALSRLLETAGDHFQNRWTRYVTRLMGMLEPALIILIGILVLVITLSVLMPVMALNRSLGG